MFCRMCRDAGKAALDAVKEELKAGKTVIISLEGSRGEPEKNQEIKKGVSYLASEFPDVPVIPCWQAWFKQSSAKR